MIEALESLLDNSTSVSSCYWCLLSFVMRVDIFLVLHMPGNSVLYLSEYYETLGSYLSPIRNTDTFVLAGD